LKEGVATLVIALSPPPFSPLGFFLPLGRISENKFDEKRRRIHLLLLRALTAEKRRGRRSAGEKERELTVCPFFLGQELFCEKESFSSLPPLFPHRFKRER